MPERTIMHGRTQLKAQWSSWANDESGFTLVDFCLKEGKALANGTPLFYASAMHFDSWVELERFCREKADE